MSGNRENRLNFTKAAIDALPVPAEGRRWDWHYDTKTRFLAIRVSQQGSKTFYYYRWIGGKAQQKSLGRYPEMTIEQARKRADELNGAVALGAEDLKKASGSTRGEMTFGDLFKWYYKNHSLTKRSVRDDEMQFRLHFQGLVNTRLSKITKTELRQLHKSIAERTRKYGKDGKTIIRSGHYAANKALRLLRTIFNAAIAEDLFAGPNPATSIEWFKEQSRERRLMLSEIPTFLKAVEEEPNETLRDFVMMSLLTGARRSNVLAMRWDQLDLVNRNWHIPITKNGKPQDIPLEDLEVEILKRRKIASTSPWVFPGDGVTGHLQEPKKGWKRILKRAGIEELRLHDLRRSLGSLMVDSGASIPVIGKALNHLSPQSTAIYARLSQAPVRQAKRKAHALLKKVEGSSSSNSSAAQPKSKLVAKRIAKARQQRKQRDASQPST